MGYSVKCPQCNAINSSGSLFCLECQTSLNGIPQEKDTSVIENSEIKNNDSQTSKTTDGNGNTHIKIGLIVGVIGFFVVSFITIGGCFCGGLFLSIGMGVISGLLTSHYVNIGTINTASRLGAISGGVAGVFTLLGQVFGGIIPSISFATVQTLGVFPNEAVGMSNQLFSAFFLPSLFNGVIGLIASTIAGSITARKKFH